MNVVTQLRAFHAVAEHGGFTAAARILRVSQPAITMHVKALEAAYQVELFVRRTRRVELTPLGRALYSVTAQLFDCTARAEELLGAATGLGGGRMRIGADNPYHLMPILAAFRRRYPQVRVDVTFGNSAAIIDGLAAFHLDAGLVAQLPRDRRLVATEISRDPLMVVVDASHRWARRKSIALAALDGIAMLRREAGSRTQERFDRACAEVGVSPRTELELGSREALREAIANGLGIGVISRAELGRDDRIHAIAIGDASVAIEEYVVHAASRSSSALIRAFAELAIKP